MAARSSSLNLGICDSDQLRSLTAARGLILRPEPRRVCRCASPQKRLAARAMPASEIRFAAVRTLLPRSAPTARGLLGDIGEMPHQAGIQELPQRIVNGLQLQIHQLVVEVGNAAPVEPVREPVPGLLCCGPQAHANRERRGTGTREGRG